MGFFANNTVAERYFEKWCSRCVHGGPCTVLRLHSIWNEEEDPIKSGVLDLFIPRKGISNLACTMFYERQGE